MRRPSVQVSLLSIDHDISSKGLIHEDTSGDVKMANDGIAYNVL